MKLWDQEFLLNVLREQGLHINEDHFIAELIDPKTLKPVKNGEEGELVITTITKQGFPFDKV